MLLIEDGCVDGSGEGGLGDEQIDLEGGKPSLLQMESRFLRVIPMPRLWIGRELDRGSDRVIVAGRGVAIEQFSGNLLAIDRVFEGRAHVYVVEGRTVY